MGEPIQPTSDPTAPAWDVASEQDVRACYRLLLEREPDAEGFASWSRLLATQSLTLREVVEGFLQSPERLALEARRLEAERIDVGEFRIWVRRADPQVGFAIARDRQYEPHLSARVRALLGPGAVFVDVGANIGWYTLLAAARVGAKGRVYAFEARADNAALLQRSLDDNGFANVEVHRCAVSDRAGSLAFFASGTWYSNGRIVGDAEPGSEQLPRVPAVTLDEALADAPRVDVIKMDIEGAEAKALAGMGALLRRHRPVLLTEFSPDLLRISSGVEPEAYLAALAAGHALYVLPADGGPEQGPFAPAEILAAQQAAGGTHLDLVAVPR